MILGIGTDVVDIVRIREKVTAREAFSKMVFSEAEIAYCERVKNKFESYAARFAAKEALLKALGTGLSISHELNEIEVRHQPSGKPYLVLSAKLEEKVKEVFGVTRFSMHLSLSHSSQVATAFVIIESVEGILDVGIRISDW